MAEPGINKASQDAIAAGEIHKESQLNPADAGFVDKTGKDVAPFDPHATPEGSEPNPGDVAAAKRLRAAGKSDEEIAAEMNVRPDIVVAWIGEAEGADNKANGGGKKSTSKKAK
jgi:hypothetical protein